MLSSALVEPIVDGSFDRLEQHFLCHVSGADPSRLLAQGRLVPTGGLAVVGTRVERAIHHNGPDLGRRAVGLPVLAEGRNV